MRFRKRCTWAGIVLGLVLSALSSQDLPQQPRLQYDLTVTLKLIQAYVTDKDGSPVRDLTKDDFLVFDSGKPVAVTAFEKHELGPVSLDSETANQAESVEAPRDLHRKFIIFFDFAFNNQKGVMAGVKAAQRFLNSALSPGDQAALLSYSMLKGLRVHEFLTTDLARVRNAISAVTAKEIAGRADEIEQAYWRLVGMNPSGGDHRQQAELSALDMQRQDSTHQAQNYLLALTSLAQALRLVQGQKNILFFSTGVPYSLVYTTRSAGSSQDPRARGLSEGTSQFDIGNSVLPSLQEKMLKEFSASACTFYAFDTRESAKLADLFGIDQQGFTSGLVESLRSAEVRQEATSPFRDEKTTGMDTLKRFSKQTGGSYYSNIALYEKNVTQVRDVTGTYYVLGYSVPTTRDGAFRDLKVEVKRKSVRVRTQAGYFNGKPFREYTELDKRLNLLDLALNGRSDVQIPMAASISVLIYDLGSGTKLRAIAHVPRDILAGLGGQRVEFVAVFFNEQGNLLSLQRNELDIAKVRGRDVVLSAGAAVKPGRAKCRLILRDLETGQSVLATADAAVREQKPEGLRLYTPLLLARSPGAWLIDGVLQGAPEAPAWREVYGYDASAFTPVVGNDPVEGQTLVVAVPFSVAGLEQPDPVFKINLVNSATGENAAVPFNQTLSGRREGVYVRHLEIPAGPRPPGNYLLYVHAQDKATGALASTYVQVSLGAAGNQR